MQIWDASGNLIFDIDDHAGRLTGTTTVTAGVAGSFTVPNASQGEIYYYFLPDNPPTIVSIGPEFFTTDGGGTILSWSWPSAVSSTHRLGGTLIYGVR